MDGPRAAPFHCGSARKGNRRRRCPSDIFVCVDLLGGKFLDCPIHGGGSAFTGLLCYDRPLFDFARAHPAWTVAFRDAFELEDHAADRALGGLALRPPPASSHRNQRPLWPSLRHERGIERVLGSRNFPRGDSFRGGLGYLENEGPQTGAFRMRLDSSSHHSGLVAANLQRRRHRSRSLLVYSLDRICRSDIAGARSPQQQ